MAWDISQKPRVPERVPAGSGGFRVFTFRPKSGIAEAPLHFLAGSAAGSGGFRGGSGDSNVRKQANCVRLVGKNSWAPNQNSAGSGGLRRAPRAKTSLGVRVRAGSGRFCCKGTALDLPTKVQAASEGPGRFRWVLTDSGGCIRHFDPTNQRSADGWDSIKGLQLLEAF